MNNAKANILSGIFGACVGAIPTSLCILSNAVSHYPALLSVGVFATAATGIITIGSKGLSGSLPAPRALPILVGLVTLPTASYALISALS